MFNAGDKIGSYRIVRPLGKGGMGEVYEVEHARLGVHYALKAFMLDHGDVALLRERFVAEGKVLARLNHPNLVRVFELDQDAKTGVLYFVMDLVRGAETMPSSFSDLEEHPVDERVLARWFVQLCAALDYIHARGIVHRDIKPSNILVDEKGDVRLVDFGISRYIGVAVQRELFLSARKEDGTWKSGTLNLKMGTGGFMAPEVAAGKSATAASDAYSLGLVLFHLLTGLWYVPRRDMLRMLESLEGNWRPALEALLKPSPDERPKTLSGLGEEIFSEAAPPEQMAVAKPRRRWFRGFAAAGVLLMAGLASWAFFRTPKAPPSLPAVTPPSKPPSAPPVATSLTPSVQPSTVPPSAPPVASPVAPPEAPPKTPSDTPPSTPRPPSTPTSEPSADTLPLGEAFEVELANDAVLSFVWCPPGEFTMGSPADEQGRFLNETPHRVKLTRGFWIADRETTQGQWKSVMDGETVVDLARKALASTEDDNLGAGNVEAETTPGLTDRWKLSRAADPASRCGDIDDDAPVYYVSWEQATNFCARLNARARKLGYLPAGYAYRLPTEAEWEYACRAGSKTGLPGDRRMRIRGRNNCLELNDYAWFGGNSSNGFKGRGFDCSLWPERMDRSSLAAPRTCATRRPNDWGIHDMLGNVWEWCGDWYGSQLGSAPAVDPRGPSAGRYHVVRGGSWNAFARQCRAAYRDGFPNGLGNFIGLRVALAPVGDTCTK